MKSSQEGQAKTFKCTYQNCPKEYSHKNKMIAHLRTHVRLFSNILVQYKTIQM